MNYILDTTIITAHMKDDGNIRMKLEEAAIYGGRIFMSGITYYEIKRGLLARKAIKQLNIFDKLCKEIRILFLDNQEIFDKASEIYADLKQRGELISDADILIAAVAITKDLILVSSDSDFLRIRGAAVENWLAVKS